MAADNHSASTVLAALHNVDKFYGGQTVLEGAHLELRASSRHALIGRNGAGKSTILRLLAGTEEPDGGTVYRRDDVAVGVLDQELQLEGAETVSELSDRAFTHLDAMEKELTRLEAAGLDDPGTFASWEALHEVFERRGGYARRSRRDAVLNALGFQGREGDAVRNLSGGEKTRLGLARLLMAQPDLLLLDEPTNHLDMEMRDWLSRHLAGYSGATLIISHDRDFLDTSCQQTAEIRNARLRSSNGNPTVYRQERLEQERIEELTRQNQAKEHERLESAAAQMKAWAGQNAKLHRRARAMFKRVERFEDTMLPEAERVQGATRFSFDADDSGEIVLQAGHLSRHLDDRQLFKDVEVTLRRGDRVALLGPNGAGKTTLFRTLLGDAASDDPRGYVRTGSRVRLGYYDQELRDVDPQRTLIEELIRLTGDVEAHNLLGRFMFPFDAQYKQIGSLSGGEKARLALLKLTMGQYNLLILDEPTNHLDVEMIEALEDALNDYTGTLLMVSHDRRFVGSVADTVWELADGHLEMYPGGLEYWQFKRQEQKTLEAAAPAVAQPAGRSTARQEAPANPRLQASRWQLERRLEELENGIAGLEEQLAASNGLLSDPLGLSPEQLTEASEQHGRLEAELLEAMGEWEEITAHLEQPRS